MKKVYAIVVTYNGREYVEKCFNSLLRSSYPVHIIAVDNNSADSTVEFISKKFPTILIEKSIKNLGFGKGNNIGIRKALSEGADYFFLLNQDAWIEPTTIEILVEVFEQNLGYGLLSPIHFNAEGNRLGWYFTERVNALDCPGFINDLYFQELKKVYPIHFIHASGWFLSKECIRKTGIFDPVFPHYGEDNDLAQRIRMNNYKIGIVTTTKLYHVGKYSGEKKYDKSKERYFKYIQYLINLKNLQFSLNYNLFQLVREVTGELMISIISRKFGKIGDIWAPFRKAVIQLKQIKRSRRVSKNNGAFI